MFSSTNPYPLSKSRPYPFLLADAGLDRRAMDLNGKWGPRNGRLDGDLGEGEKGRGGDVEIEIDSILCRVCGFFFVCIYRRFLGAVHFVMEQELGPTI